jgi:catechol 2,3-dioxygenase-like lactoylglutathione lyase family enzyme
MPLDHVSVGCKDVKKAKAFYDAVLGHIGMQPVMPVELPGPGLVAVGYGEAADKPVFWVQLPFNRQPASFGNGVHVCFSAETREAVDAFYLEAMERGGIDDGRPGLRTEYHPDYYAAFIRDPDGNKIEAVCHAGA